MITYEWAMAHGNFLVDSERLRRGAFVARGVYRAYTAYRRTCEKRGRVWICGLFVTGKQARAANLPPLRNARSSLRHVRCGISCLPPVTVWSAHNASV
jgi:hypothetical protein